MDASRQWHLLQGGGEGGGVPATAAAVHRFATGGAGGEDQQ